MSEADLNLAIQLQAQFDEELKQLRETSGDTKQIKGIKKAAKNYDIEPVQETLSVSLIDESWEVIDPTPNIHDLFLTFNEQFFWGRLISIEVKWSPRMTTCAGICSYDIRGGLCSVRLSTPLLKLRPRKDLVETLLHEMIHAYLFVTHNDTDHDGHGAQFHKHMDRINRLAGTKISVYHSFHNEVRLYKQHVWKCNGPCSKRPPYYGLVKRAMNRVPGPNDLWWDQHQMSCGGTYNKIKEPEGYGDKKKKKKDEKSQNSNDIRNFFSKNNAQINQDGVKINGFHNINKRATESRPRIDEPLGTGSGFNLKNNGKLGTNTSSFGKKLISNSINSNGKLINDKDKKSKNSGRSLGTRNPGSSTVVLKNPKTKNQEKVVDNDRLSERNFSGAGYKLGSNSSPNTARSKFLDRLETESKRIKLSNEIENKDSGANSSQLGNNLIKPMENEKNNRPKVNNTKNSLISNSAISNSGESKKRKLSDEDVKISECPLCQIQIKSNNEFDAHIQTCLGDLDDYYESADEDILENDFNYDDNGIRNYFNLAPNSSSNLSSNDKNRTNNYFSGHTEILEIDSDDGVEIDTKSASLQKCDQYSKIKTTNSDTLKNSSKCGATKLKTKNKISALDNSVCIIEDDELDETISNMDLSSLENDLQPIQSNVHNIQSARSDRNIQFVRSNTNNISIVDELIACIICGKRFDGYNIDAHTNSHFE